VWGEYGVLVIDTILHTGQLKLSEGELGERVLRSEHRLPATAGLELSIAATRKRKPLTAEQLEERRKKVSKCVGVRIHRF
jgi:hypothetical protein